MDVAANNAAYAPCHGPKKRTLAAANHEPTDAGVDQKRRARCPAIPKADGQPSVDDAVEKHHRELSRLVASLRDVGAVPCFNAPSLYYVPSAIGIDCRICFRMAKLPVVWCCGGYAVYCFSCAETWMGRGDRCQICRTIPSSTEPTVRDVIAGHALNRPDVGARGGRIAVDAFAIEDRWETSCLGQESGRVDALMTDVSMNL